MSIKLVVLYPYPKDQEAFERAYTSEHIPLVARLAKKLGRCTKAVYTQVLMSPQGLRPSAALPSCTTPLWRHCRLISLRPMRRN